MLSKSAARAFFLVGTVLCSGVFLALTFDTFKKIPEQTHEDRLSASVVRGKQLWEDNNCMGCHTLFGEGAYYAPDLSRVFKRRGAMFIRQIVNDPQAMYPGERKMVDYDFSDAELDDLVAFFEWCGEVDLNGFPAPPTIGMMAVAQAQGATGDRPEVFNQVCVACHSIGGLGGRVGPALDGIGGRMSAADIRRRLQDPLAVDPNSKMPKLPLTAAQIESVVDYLSSLKHGAAQ